MASIMRRKEVTEATGLSYTSIFNKERAGLFPSRRQLGVRSVGWLRSEVEGWIEGLAAGIRPIHKA